MPFLTIAGIDVPVVHDGGPAEREPVVVGSVTRAFSGAGLSSVRASFRVWQFQSMMSEAEAATLRAAAPPGAFVACAGDALGGTTFTCAVTFTASGYVGDGLGFRRAPSLTLEQVA